MNRNLYKWNRKYNLGFFFFFLKTQESKASSEEVPENQQATYSYTYICNLRYKK